MFNINKYDTILSPVITEKSTNLSAQNKVVFKVLTNACLLYTSPSPRDNR